MRRLGLVLALCACSESTPPTPTVESVRLLPAGASVELGRTTLLSAVGLDASGNPITGRPVLWTSSDEQRATVGGGLVLAKYSGPVQITATIDGKSATVTVMVTTISDWSEVTQDWTTLQGSPAHTGYVPATIDTAAIRSEFNFSANGVADMVVGGGRLYLLSQGGPPYDVTVQARDENTGLPLWSRVVGQFTGVSGLTYANERVFFTTGTHANSYLIALDAGTGADAYRRPYQNQGATFLAPAVASGRVVMGGGEFSGVYGLDEATGDSVYFSSLVQQYGWTPAVLAGQGYVFGRQDSPAPVHALSAFDATTGVHDYEIADAALPQSGTPILLNATTAVASVLGSVAVVDLAGRSVTWSATGSYLPLAAVAPDAAYVLVNAFNPLVRPFRLSDGLIGTDFAIPAGQLQGNLVVTKNLVFVASTTDTYAFFRSNSALAWHRQGGGSLAITQNGRLIIWTGGNVSVVRLKEAPAP